MPLTIEVKNGDRVLVVHKNPAVVERMLDAAQEAPRAAAAATARRKPHRRAAAAAAPATE